VSGGLQGFGIRQQWGAFISVIGIPSADFRLKELSGPDLRLKRANDTERCAVTLFNPEVPVNDPILRRGGDRGIETTARA